MQTEEKEYVIPILKDILAINPTIKILGSPWTCPKWMKVNNLEEKKPFDSWTSGQLNPDYYRDYATYFVKWIEAFRKEGIDIYSVTPQNEPLNRGNSASLFLGWKEELAFVRDALGPAFKAADWIRRFMLSIIITTTITWPISNNTPLRYMMMK